MSVATSISNICGKRAASGLPVANVDSVLPFRDQSFDSVLIFEVLEHVADIEKVLSEAFRVARKNVLITVPNSEDIELMKANDVTYAHMLSSDHLHFFDPESLADLLQALFRACLDRTIRSDLSVLVFGPIGAFLWP